MPATLVLLFNLLVPTQASVLTRFPFHVSPTSAQRRTAAQDGSGSLAFCTTPIAQSAAGAQDNPCCTTAGPDSQKRSQGTTARRIFEKGRWKTILPTSMKWKIFCNDPTKYWDNRGTKRGVRSPDFKSKHNSKHVWLDSAPHWAKQHVLELDSLAAGDERKPEPYPTEAELWQSLVQHGGVVWNDNRGYKEKNSTHPDFQHRRLNLGLWLGPNTPSWVLSNLDNLGLSPRLAKPSLELPKVIHLPAPEFMPGFPQQVEGLPDDLSKAAAQAIIKAQEHNCGPDAAADPPPGSLNDELKPYQRRALAWMLRREAPGAMPSGGILADEQGLGKTVTAIALILSNPRPVEPRLPSPGRGTPIHQPVSSSPHGGTLVVCPTSVLKQWMYELFNKVSDEARQKVHVYYSAGRKKQSSMSLAQYDVVLTTYGTVRVESGMAKRQRSAQQGRLYEVDWHRVILDECQEIKNKKSLVASAVHLLQADLRWAMSGTPLQNYPHEFFPLLVFLRFSPWDVEEVFNRMIRQAPGELGYERLRSISAAILLQRKKVELRHEEDSFKLPRNIVELALTFSPDEQTRYDGLAESTLKEVEDNPQAFYFTLLQKLQNACRHPWLVDGYRPAPTPPQDHAFAPGPACHEMVSAQGIGQASCMECFHHCDRCFMLGCNHVLCSTCLVKQGVPEAHLSSPDLTLPCAICERWAAYDAAHSDNEYEFDELDATVVPWESSTKLDAVFSLVQRIQTESGGADKVLVFSERTATLNIIQRAPQWQGINHRRLDGTMKPAQRDRVVTEFQNDLDVKVFLVSKKAGNSGLNLTAANHVIILDPWYNLAVEEQAIDRTHRIGQRKPVHVYKLFIKGTVEERMLKLQQYKSQLIAGVLSGPGRSVPGSVSMGKQGLTRDEILFLVSGKDTLRFDRSSTGS